MSFQTAADRSQETPPLSPDPVRVLLVCTGNICRSPIAHGLLATRSAGLTDGGITVLSAGTAARGGSPATHEAVAAASEIGADITGHRATRFSGDLAVWADLILTMTAEQASEVAEIAPDATPKTFTLKELVGLLEALPPVSEAGDRETVLHRLAEAHRIRTETREPQLADADMADPLGLSQTVYRAVAHEIAGLIDRLVAGLAWRSDAAPAQGA